MSLLHIADTKTMNNSASVSEKKKNEEIEREPGKLGLVTLPPSEGGRRLSENDLGRASKVIFEFVNQGQYLEESWIS